MKLSALQLENAIGFCQAYVDPAVVSSVLMKVYPEERFRLMINPKLETAATHYDAKAEEHVIFIGTNYKDFDRVYSAQDKKAFVQALYLHEVGHTVHTDKNLKLISEICKENNIPFSLLNLAEDARIEYLIKKTMKDKAGMRYTFDWTTWMRLPEQNANMDPESILYSMITTENNKPILALQSKEVGQFYERFISAPDTFSVIEILKEWMEKFHKNDPKAAQNAMNSLSATQSQSQNSGEGKEKGTGQNQDKGEADSEEPSESGKPTSKGGKDKNKLNDERGKKHFSDMENSLGMEMDQEAFESMMASSIDYNEIIQMTNENTPYKIETDFDTIVVEEASNTKTIFSDKNPEGKFYDHQIKEIERLFRRLKKEKISQNETRNFSRRMNTKKFAYAKSGISAHKMYKEDVKKSKTQGRKILFSLDLSGSMRGMPSDSQRTILIAANKIANSEKKYKIAALGTKIKGRGGLYQTIQLPCNERVLIGCDADGNAEGIRNGMENNKKLFKEADLVVFITDGNVHDGEISEALIRKHIRDDAISVGIYVGPERIPNPEMHKWFDTMIIKDNVVDAVEELVSFIEHPRQAKIHSAYKQHISIDTDISTGQRMKP